MRRFLFAVVLSSAPCLLLAADDEAKKEYARFEGTWRFTFFEIEGTRLPEDASKNTRLILEGRHFTLRGDATALKGTYKVDLSKKPKQIDVTFADGPDKGKTVHGIYELDGDTYRVCMGLPGKSRPTAFESKPGSGHVLEVLKREKSPSKEEAVKKELAKLKGTWQLVSAETDGVKLPAEQVKQIRVIIQEGKHSVYFGEKVVADGVEFHIDPSASPKTTEDTLKDGKKIRGIYKLEGDTLTSCVAAPDKERPSEFTGKKGSGYTLRVFKRTEP
jgi:uncharacterized protein (TIGR03067 family)